MTETVTDFIRQQRDTSFGPEHQAWMNLLSILMDSRMPREWMECARYALSQREHAKDVAAAWDAVAIKVAAEGERHGTP